MGLIKENWDQFEKQAIHKRAPDIQRQEMRRAFYAGAAITYVALSRAVSEGDGVSDDDVSVLRDFEDELLAFSKAVQAGEA